MAADIQYTGTFKTIQEIVDWINNFEPVEPVDEHFEVKSYTDINGNTVNALYQLIEEE